jgi:hypothetical protein
MDMQRNDETGVRGLVETAVYERRTTIWCGRVEVKGGFRRHHTGWKKKKREQEMYFMAK